MTVRYPSKFTTLSRAYRGEQTTYTFSGVKGGVNLQQIKLLRVTPEEAVDLWNGGEINKLGGSVTNNVMSTETQARLWSINMDHTPNGTSSGYIFIKTTDNDGLALTNGWELWWPKESAQHTFYNLNASANDNARLAFNSWPGNFTFLTDNDVVPSSKPAIQDFQETNVENTKYLVYSLYDAWLKSRGNDPLNGDKGTISGVELVVYPTRDARSVNSSYVFKTDSGYRSTETALSSYGASGAMDTVTSSTHTGGATSPHRIRKKTVSSRQVYYQNISYQNGVHNDPDATFGTNVEYRLKDQRIQAGPGLTSASYYQFAPSLVSVSPGSGPPGHVYTISWNGGNAAPSFSVKIFRPNGQILTQTTTDREGTARAALSEVGTYRILAENTYGKTVQTFTVGAGQSVRPAAAPTYTQNSSFIAPLGTKIQVAHSLLEQWVDRSYRRKDVTADSLMPASGLIPLYWDGAALKRMSSADIIDTFIKPTLQTMLGQGYADNTEDFKPYTVSPSSSIADYYGGKVIYSDTNTNPSSYSIASRPSGWYGVVAGASTVNVQDRFRTVQTYRLFTKNKLLAAIRKASNAVDYVAYDDNNNLVGVSSAQLAQALLPLLNYCMCNDNQYSIRYSITNNGSLTQTYPPGGTYRSTIALGSAMADTSYSNTIGEVAISYRGVDEYRSQVLPIKPGATTSNTGNSAQLRMYHVSTTDFSISL